MQATHVQSNFSSPFGNNSQAICVQESSGVLKTLTSATNCIIKLGNIPMFLLVQEAYLPSGKPQYTYLDDCARHWCHC